MTTFTMNGTTYTRKDNGYCFANGKRIKLDAFNAAYDQYIEAAAEQGEERANTAEHEEIRKELRVKSAAPKAPEAKKTRKPRKVKDAQEFNVDGTKVLLTTKQVDFIHHLPDTSFWENGLESCIWCDVLCDEIGGQFRNKPMTVGAMLSTICEKGLGVRVKDRINGRNCTAFKLTKMGQQVANMLGLE